MNDINTMIDILEQSVFQSKLFHINNSKEKWVCMNFLRGEEFFTICRAEFKEEIIFLEKLFRRNYPNLDKNIFCIANTFFGNMIIRDIDTKLFLPISFFELNKIHKALDFRDIKL